MSNISLETKVAVIEEAVGRYEEAISKLVEVSQDLKQIIAIHEVRHQERERAEITLKNSLDKETNIIHGRINNLSAETKKEIDEHHGQIMKALTEIRDEQKQYHESLNSTVISPIETRISNLERWRWVAVGAVIVVSYIISNIPWQNFFGG
jgi:DNA anti-recombination protein RmuC